MSYRITTVQFAVPADDPAYRLTELRDQLQETLYDQEGYSGSFSIIGTEDCEGYPDDHFQRCALDLGAIKSNASEVIRQETLAERTARAWGWEHMPNDPSGKCAGPCLFNNNLDRIRAAWDWEGACADIDVKPGEFPERFSIDGFEADDPDSMQSSEGQFPPFRIFDSSAQEYLFGEFQTRAELVPVVNSMNNHYHQSVREGKAA
jgi:hypothetical protein